MADEKSLNRYACDYCWKKKTIISLGWVAHTSQLRCSREKPKCKNCSCWTSDCKYSRELSEGKQGPIVRDVPASNLGSEQAGRLGGPGLGFAVFQRSSNAQMNHDQLPEFSDDALSSVTSTFSHTRDVLNCDQIRQNLTDITIQGTCMLSDLYSQFKDSTYDYDKIKAAVRMTRREQEAFFIPTEPVGQMFVQCFLRAVGRGYPLISQPPEEMLFDLVFRPSSVEKRGWVLMLNTILATASTQSQQLSEYTFHLRWNAWLAADEASLFMEPTVLNIQALTIFAVHGQDLVTPSLCWNLTSQACRMAQMIKLSLPSASATKNSEAYSHNLCLFWSLFIIDKSLSLSFGYPPVLPSALYQNVDLPSPRQLSAYRPHLANPDTGSDLPPHVEFFGAFYFVQCTKLAMTMGKISEFYLLGSRNSRHHLELKKELDQWISIVQQSQSMHTNLADATDPVTVSIRLGFNFLNYQYHHLIVCLTRGDKTSRETCLRSARAAISLLKGLVAHSEQVFNGIIWQQLYYPFTPFFVLFGEVINNPTSTTSVEDLQLLRQTVLYFLEFQKYHISAVKLEKVAETFTKIAEAYARHVFRKQSGMTNSDHFRINKPLILPAQARSGPPTALASLNYTVPPMPHGDTDSVGPNLEIGDQRDYQLRLDETCNLDPTSLLHLFSYQGDDATTLQGFHITGIQPESMQGWEERETCIDNSHALENCQISEPGRYVSLRDVEINGRNQFSHCTFDWFALEKYAM